MKKLLMSVLAVAGVCGIQAAEDKAPIWAPTAKGGVVVYGYVKGSKVSSPAANVFPVDTKDSYEVKSKSATCYAGLFASDRPEGIEYQVACNTGVGFADVYTTETEGAYCNYIGSLVDEKGKKTYLCDKEPCVARAFKNGYCKLYWKPKPNK